MLADDARADLVVVGASLGGSAALGAILGALTEDFALPIVIVLHRARDPEASLVALLQRTCVLPIEEAEDKAPLVPGHVYVAPADYHLLVEARSLALSVEEPVLLARPSIDVLFESAAASHGARVVGVILTCASKDGEAGAAKIKARGGRVIVQEPASAASPILPDAVIAARLADRVLSLQEIGRYLRSLHPALEAEKAKASPGSQRPS